MLVYATIFIASIIVAAVIIFLYKVISSSSRSVYSSKEHISLPEVQPNYQKDKAVINRTPDFLHKGTHASPRHMAKTHPAMPTETYNWGWNTSGNQSRQKADQAATAGNSSHCSLYDMKTESPGMARDRKSGWPYREEKTEPAGKVYKVKRRTAPRSGDSEELEKPWGW
jgi:hypothetical protein